MPPVQPWKQKSLERLHRTVSGGGRMLTLLEVSNRDGCRESLSITYRALLELGD
jgi:hypothetical protein